MKTKDAFAMRDFDKDKILQRKLFVRAEIGGEFFLKDNRKSDAEILKSFQETGDVNVNENNLKKLRVLLEIATHYQEKFIDKRHLPRLTRFKRATKNKELRQRADELQKKYDDVADTFTIFELILRQDIEKLERAISNYHSRTFTARLKQARLDRGLTQQELADSAGVHRIALTEYENLNKEREPKLITAVMLAKRLGVSLDWLTGIKD